MLGNINTEHYNTHNLLYYRFINSVSEDLNNHPFNSLNSKSQILLLFPHFLALSLSFPYLQAGSQLSLILDIINDNTDISEHLEITSVVGNFLCWEETGGANVVEKYGKMGLPKILETRKRFHANLLRKDMEKLSGQKVYPDFSEPTRSYLLSLLQGLRDQNPVIRSAYMTAFEVHAHTIIEALWKAIGTYFDCLPNELTYFMCHVGGKDPAEAYHIAMAAEMVHQLVSINEEELFLISARKALHEILNWCASISNLPSEMIKEEACGLFQG